MQKKRIWEVDFLRGVALILMIYFHTVFDMKEIFGYDVSYAESWNFYIGKASGILFIFVAGISSSLTGSNPKRAVKILIAAMLITLATYLYNSSLVITFGILHFLGVSILLAPVFRRIPAIGLLLLGTAVILLNQVISGLAVAHNYLFMFGLSTTAFVSSDFYPLIPWFGVFLYGLAAGKTFYYNKRSVFGDFGLSQSNIINRAGSHTLFIYLLHQPAIIAVLTLLGKAKGFL
jgi:uncharacterized membrane protein